MYLPRNVGNASELMTCSEGVFALNGAALGFSPVPLLKVCDSNVGVCVRRQNKCKKRVHYFDN
jgi:hypothetical protein